MIFETRNLPFNNFPSYHQSLSTANSASYTSLRSFLLPKNNGSTANKRPHKASPFISKLEREAILAGRDTGSLKKSISYSEFLSTRPSRDATFLKSQTDKQDYISIHAPLTGRDSLKMTTFLI